MRSPFVSHAIDAARRIANQQARFEAAFQIRVRFVGRQLEGFYENGSARKAERDAFEAQEQGVKP